MEKAYWLARKRAALKSAQIAATSKARLAHYDLAGRYSVRAASAGTPPAADQSPAEKVHLVWP